MTVSPEQAARLSPQTEYLGMRDSSRSCTRQGAADVVKKYDQMKIRSDLSCGVECVKQAGDLIEQACHLVRGLRGRPIVRYRARRA